MTSNEIEDLKRRQEQESKIIKWQLLFFWCICFLLACFLKSHQLIEAQKYLAVAIVILPVIFGSIYLQFLRDKYWTYKTESNFLQTVMNLTFFGLLIAVTINISSYYFLKLCDYLNINEHITSFITFFT